MSRIRIRIYAVKGIGSSLNQNYLKTSNIKDGLSTLRYSVSSSIQERRNIGERLQGAYISIGNIEEELRDLQAFINRSSDSYSSAEDHLITRAASIGASGNAYSICTPEGRTVLEDFDQNISNQSGESSKKNDYKDIFDDYARDPAIGFGSAALNSGKLLITNKNLKFKMFRQDGKIFIKIKDGIILNNKDYMKYRNLIKSDLGGKWKWNRNFMSRLTDEGVPLYDEATKRTFKSNLNKLSNTQFDDLNKYVSQIGQSKFKVMGSTFKNTFTENAKVWDSFTGWKGASTMTKTGKGLGILGLGLTAYKNITDDFYNSETGCWEFKGENLKEFAVDLTVDVGTGAGAMAVGAAVAGALILPPAGMIAGAVLGVGINTLINVEIGNPPRSIVDRTKDIANKTVDLVGNKLVELFW